MHLEGDKLGRVLRKQKTSCSKSKLQHIQLPDTTGTSQWAGFHVEIKLQIYLKLSQTCIHFFFVLLNTKEDIFKNVCNKADLGHLSYGTSTSRGKEFGSIDACSAFPFKKLKT